MPGITLMVTLCMIAVLLLFILISRVSVEFFYSRVEQDDLLRLKIRALYGLFRYQYDVPIINWSGSLKSVKFLKESINQNVQHVTGKDKGKITRHTIVRQVENWNALLRHTLGLNRWLIRTMKQVHCTSIEWTTKAGVGEAPDTAITAGLLWGIKSSMLGYVFRFVQLHEMPVVNVTPLFNQVKLEIRFAGHLYIRMNVLLAAGLQLFVRIIRAKNGLRYIFRSASWTQ
jgi:hypothetical protein